MVRHQTAAQQQQRGWQCSSQPVKSCAGLAAFGDIKLDESSQPHSWVVAVAVQVAETEPVVIDLLSDSDDDQPLSALPPPPGPSGEHAAALSILPMRLFSSEEALCERKMRK